MTKGKDKVREGSAGVTGKPLSEGKREADRSESNEASADQKTQPDQEDDEEDKPFDFGGLPDRNLKKNLGCG